MMVGVMTAQLNLAGIKSLKEKRSIVKSLTMRLRNNFNVSVAEVDHNQSKRSAVIGISIVSNETGYIDQQFDKIINFMQRDGRFYLGPIDRETF